MKFEIEQQNNPVCCLKIKPERIEYTKFNPNGEAVGTYTKLYASVCNGHVLSNLALLINKHAVKRGFNGDVFSVRRKDGSLYLTQAPRGDYPEYWANPDYVGLVIPVQAFNKKNEDFFNAKGGVADCIKYCQENFIPVFIMKKTGKLEVYKNENS